MKNKTQLTEENFDSDDEFIIVYENFLNEYKQSIFRDFGSILGTKRIEAYFKNIFGVYKTHFIEHELTLGKNEILPLMEKLGTFITIACINDITRQPANFSPNYK